MTFRNTTKANCLFRLMYISIIYRKAKIGKHLAYLAYIFNAFFLFWGDLGALVVSFLLVAGHQLETYPR